MGLHEASRRLFLSLSKKLSSRSEWVDYNNLFTVLKTIYLWIVYKYSTVSPMVCIEALGERERGLKRMVRT